jgi:hypothetical protein
LAPQSQIPGLLVIVHKDWPHDLIFTPQPSGVFWLATTSTIWMGKHREWQRAITYDCLA